MPHPIDDAAEYFADIAAHLHEASDAGSTVQRIAEQARAAVQCDEAGVLLALAGEPVEAIAATGAAVEQLAALEAAGGDGPGSGIDPAGIVIDDLALEGRWPDWRRAAVAAGLRSAVSMPLRTSERRLGSLLLCARRPHAFSEDDLAVARVLSRHAALALATAQEAEGLRRALDSRKLIGQAQGILMERFGIGAEQAFRLLSRQSQDRNRKLVDVARGVIGRPSPVGRGEYSARRSRS